MNYARIILWINKSPYHGYRHQKIWRTDSFTVPHIFSRDISQAKMIFVVGLLFTAATLCSSASQPPRVIVPKNATLANLAWGFNSGGEDNLNGQYVVLVDIDGVTTEQMTNYKNQGRIVQCYFSVGTAEPWRPDFNKSTWDPLAVGTLPQFSNEFWLDLTQLPLIEALMGPRFTRAKKMGCDAIEADNTDCYDNSECNNPIVKKHPGTDVKALDIEFCRWLVHTAHQLGLSISLKNSIEIIPDLVDIYDFAGASDLGVYRYLKKMT